MQDISRQENAKLIVYTGLSTILSTKHQILYLGDDIIEVPLVQWKLVIDPDPDIKAHIVFAILMNDKPTDDDKKNFESVCPCICERLGYKFNDNHQSGLTRCCTLSDLTDKVPYMKSFNELKEYERYWLMPSAGETQSAKNRKAIQSCGGRAKKKTASSRPGAKSKLKRGPEELNAADKPPAKKSRNGPKSKSSTAKVPQK